VVVGLALANQRRAKRQSASPRERAKQPSASPPPAPGSSARTKAASVPPPPRQTPLVLQRDKPPTQPPPPPRAKLPSPFDDKTRAVNDPELIAALRGEPPTQRPDPRSKTYDDPTPLGAPSLLNGIEDSVTQAAGDLAFLAATTERAPLTLEPDDEANRLAGQEALARAERVERAERAAGGARARPRGANDERTRAVDIRDDPSISDVDWDIDS
jgi:hypothetical protein